MRIPQLSAILAPLTLAILVTIVFISVFQAGFVDYDDPALVLKNGYVRDGFSTPGLRWAFTQENLGLPLMHEGVSNLWHPLTWLSHMFDMQVFGEERPWGHHFSVNPVSSLSLAS